MTSSTASIALLAAWTLTGGAAFGASTGPDPLQQDPRVGYAQQLLAQANLPQKVALAIVASKNGPESFRIAPSPNGVTVTGSGPAGLLYGVQELLSRQEAGTLRDGSRAQEKPDFALRGNALFLMKEGNYNFQLTPKEFPWFYDRPLLTKYLDYLFANRFNTIFLWSGCLWPSIVEMPEYPDATDLSAEQVKQNQEQFRWFTDECAKRNISVLMHFYSIQIPGPMAKARKIPLNYSKPTAFTAKLIGYCLTRFLTEFKSVGLYVCPGEALDPQYTAAWINDVIFKAAKACGHNPRVVVRDWGLDAEGFTKNCIGKYDNLYTELKHNIEMIVSPVPDDRHARWRGLGAKHIVNLHEVSDVKPFRWGSPTFIAEMVKEWHRAGIVGGEIYNMTSWRFPWTCDKLEPQQNGFWPDGKRLVTFERDAIWLEAVGRYLWKMNRSARAEATYWDERLGAKFGRAAGKTLRLWYDTTGPVMPGFQNLTSVLNMNWHPTVIGKEQTMDGILTARLGPGPKSGPGSNYVTRPVDSAFFARYKKEYRQGRLRSRFSMCVSEYAGNLASGKTVARVMTPDRVSALLVKLAEEGVTLSEKAAVEATENRDEAQRFVSDSKALVLVAKVWDRRVLAAIDKGVWLKTHKKADADACLSHLSQAVKNYEALIVLTDATYLNPTDMVLTLNWHNGLAALKADIAKQKKAFSTG